MKRARTLLAAAGVLLAAASQSALALDPIDRITQTGVIRIGHRESSKPFSFIDPSTGLPTGYSVDLCLAVVDQLAKDLHRTIVPRFIMVGAKDRVDRVAQGDVDLECGTTTITKDRLKKVGFSHMTFVTGIRAITKPENRVRVSQDMLSVIANNKVAVVDGTTAAKVVDFYRPTNVTYVKVKDYAEGINRLLADEVVAFIGDEVLIASALKARSTAANVAFADIGYSVEPYGLMIAPQDQRLKGAVDDALAKVYASGTADKLLSKWLKTIDMKPNMLTRDALARPTTEAATPL